MARSVTELKKQYDENVRRVKDLRVKSDKDESLTLEIRLAAQEGFELAGELRAHYARLAGVAHGEKDREELEAQEKFYAKEVENWSKWLRKYGSPMSGIPKTTFDDIAGLDDVKATIKNYLFMLKNPEIAEAYRINTNLGILLYGPPGTGKTLVAEAIAHELNVRYFVITPSQIFGSYVGESEKNVRDVFAELRACKDGSVLLIDECESIFARRDSNTNRAAIGVANQLLQEMNGQGDAGVGRRVILGATNRPELMDEAYLRYKRFSLQFYIGMPAEAAVKKVVALNLRKRPHDEVVETELIRRLLQDGYYTCADISGIVEQCAYMALSECRKRAEDLGVSEYGEKMGYVNINLTHLNKVLENYPHSVTQDMLDEYQRFHDERIRGF